MIESDNDESLQKLVRAQATLGIDIDKKQLRFNDIVRIAKTFYSTNIQVGIVELVGACDRKYKLYNGMIIDNPLYVKGKPMWDILDKEYQDLVK